jgi:hypothetical protein
LESFESTNNLPSLSSPPKYWRTPRPPFPEIDRQKNLLQCEWVWVRTMRQRHGDKRCWGHAYLWTWQRIRLRDRVWSHLMMAKKLLSTCWILFCIGPIFRYHEFFVRICVSENPSFLLLTAILLPTLASLSPPPFSLHVILLLPKAKYRYKNMINYKCCI